MTMEEIKITKCPCCGADVKDLRLDTYVDYRFNLVVDKNGDLVVDKYNIYQMSADELIENTDDENMEVYCTKCGAAFNAHMNYGHVSCPITIFHDEEEETKHKIRLSDLVKVFGEKITS